jgi:hypothetical protein|tara:strand:+ start:2604 stop:3026 length:423 start_codon:yes stop_codon:yes gene_type:complete
MRATINFDMNLDRVVKTMWALVLEESDQIRDVHESLEASQPETILEDLPGILSGLRETTNQLEQYREMLAGFERSRYEATLPPPTQPADNAAGNLVSTISQARETVQNMKRFDAFLSQADSTKEDGPEEGTDISDEHEKG